MNINDMKQKKKELGLSNAKIAELSAIPLGTIQKVFSGATESPRYETLKKLDQMFSRICGTDPAIADNRSKDSRTGSNGSSYVSESTVPSYETKSCSAEKQPGEYTLEDYYKMPDDRRVELIDGVIYDMTAPSSQHQLALNYINFKILTFLEAANASCTVYISPFDIQLDCDDKTVVQPDLSILCDITKDTGKNIIGAPDFVLEVLSPSTKKKDMWLKLHKYWHAGVREYWILDCQKKRLTVHNFENDDFEVYGPEDIVPVSIFAGKCTIDLKALFEKISK